MFSDSSFGVYTVMAQGANIGVQYNFGLIIFLISLPLFVLILILLKKSNTLYRRICGFYEKLIVCEKIGDLKTDCYYKNAAFYVFAAFWSILAILLMISVNLSLGLAFLFNAFYLVFFTLFYTHVKNIETQRQALFDEERDKLVEIERKTNQLFAEIKRKKRQEEMEQQRIEEEREREKEEIRTKLRQQKMMKELMKEIMEEEKKN